MGKSQVEIECQVKLINAALRLLDKNIPVLVFWQHDGELRKIGSKKMSDWYDDLESETKAALANEMVKDMIRLNDREEDLISNPDDIPFQDRACALLKSLSNPTGIPELPCPLSLMSQKEKTKYLSDMISVEAKKDKVKLVFGSSEWRPSFWQEDLWEWTTLDQALRMYRGTSYLGVGTFSSFLDTTIVYILSRKGLDSETHVKEMDSKKISKKERQRGIHKQPNVTRKVTDDENNVDNSSSIEPGPNDTTSTNVPDVQICENSEPDQQSFKPRRPLSDSPFKKSRSVPTNMQNLGHIPMDTTGGFEEGDEAEDRNNVGYVEAPEQVMHEIMDYRILYNSGGGSCLYKAAAQHVNATHPGSHCSYIDLRKHAHKKLVEWWNSFEGWISFPMSITVGTGRQSRTEVMLSGEQYKRFLASSSSMEAFTESAIDVWLINYILNVPISVLTYNLPDGQGVNGSRYMWNNFSGQGLFPDPENDKYSCEGTHLVLLNEHLQHWSRMERISSLYSGVSSDSPVKNFEESSYVPPSSQVLDEVSSVSSFQDLDEISPVLTSQNLEGVSSAPTLLNLEGVSSVPTLLNLEGVSSVPPLPNLEGVSSVHTVQTMEEASSVPTFQGWHDLASVPSDQILKEVSSELSYQHFEGVSSVAQGSSDPPSYHTSKALKTLTRNKPASKVVPKKRKYSIVENPEYESVKPHNIAGKPIVGVIRDIDDYDGAVKSDIYFEFPVKEASLEDLLLPPASSVLAEEAKLDNLDKEIAIRHEVFEKYVKKKTESILREKSKQKARRRRFRINRDRRNKMEADVSPEKLKEMFQENIEFIKKVFDGKIQTVRRDEYMKGGIHRDRLREKRFIPFSEDHLSALLEELSNLWMRTESEERNNSNFIWNVVLPEAFIKIYSDYFGMDKEQAEACVAETPLHAIDTSDVESETFDSEKEDSVFD